MTALLSPACCWLPLLLIAFGASAAGVSGFFETYRPYLLGDGHLELRSRRDAAIGRRRPPSDFGSGLHGNATLRIRNGRETAGETNEGPGITGFTSTLPLHAQALEGRTLKQDNVGKALSDFVLVRLEPMEWDEDREFGAKFSSLLLLDATPEKQLGVVGDVAAEKVESAPRAVLKEGGEADSSRLPP